MDAERKLVTVRTISSVEPIPDADAIEVVTVDGGWKVVVKKGDFNEGDRCLYLEIDSFLPDGNPRWQFLVDKQPKMFEGQRGHKLKTVKLRGQISQGLVLPLDDQSMEEGVDYAERFGVKKYEPPLPAELAGQAEGSFPSFLQKTDQERCQNLYADIFGYDPVVIPAEGPRPEIVKKPRASRDTLYEVTIKLDGSSCTVFHRDGESGVCSRNLQLKICENNAGNAFVRMAMLSGLLDALPAIGNFAVQGELIGEGIQGNPEKISGHKLFIFDVFDIDAHAYLSPADRMELMKRLYASGVNADLVGHVPVLKHSATLPELGITDMKSLLEYAEGPSLNEKVTREGVVFKRHDGAFSFKAISNKYLLKSKD